jgi:pimeloyl-ACP methyl ester carboxylesterase
VREQAVLFGKEKSLIGTVTDPPKEKCSNHFPAVIFLNSGIVHRVGPNRISVKMALRFDFSGIGDSRPRRDSIPFVKSSISEVQEAMDFLQELRGVQQFILVGACSGARVSFQAACQDPRVVGAFLINFNAGPTDESDQAFAELTNRVNAFYYLKSAMFSSESWKRFVTGKANYRRIVRTLVFKANRRFAAREKTPQAIQFAANVRLLTERHVSALFISSEGDPGIDDLVQAAGLDLKKRGPVRSQVIPKADHTFSSLHDQRQLIEVLDKWASYLVPSEAAPQHRPVAPVRPTG